MKATYVEIYNEQLRDLLVPDTVPLQERNNVAIREDTKGRILLTGLQQIIINSVDDLMNALNFGSSIRQTDATAINSKSSRSHAIFSLNLVQKKNKYDKLQTMSPEGMTGSEHWITIDSKLHFVDLAGSERLKNSGLTGERVKEGISINGGLASLGKVISQLSSRAVGSHVSYRDSRLTRILQDSLGGNAITYMVACVNPVEFHLSETLNTVQYAQRARNIQSKPQIQQRAEDGDKQQVIDRLRSEVAFLRDQIKHNERAERKSNSVKDRSSGRNGDKENELQNQLLDVQENYSALSMRHAKLISEIAKSKGDTGVKAIPALKHAMENSSLERLNRSNNFAEAVEHVVLEYEKTIQSLESSLSNSRSSLSTSESSLLEREAKLVYMEAVTQQLQARVQKAMDREANSESYLRDLESKLEGSNTGEEKQLLIIQELRKELVRLRESESSAEEYISTLEERLAEAEQDTDIMQREIRRLEHVVERQRTVGKMDNILTELDNIRKDEIPSGHNIVARHDLMTEDSFHDRLVATTSASHPNGEILPDAAEAEWKSFGPMEGDDETGPQDDLDVQHQTTKAQEKIARAGGHRIQSQAQARAIADKLETVTMELFDLRVEHENTVGELDDVARKYQIALSTLADLQDAVDEARTRPGSFLGQQSLHSARQDGHRLSLHMLSSQLSSLGDAPTLVGESEIASVSERDLVSPNKDRESLADAVRRLKRANAEKDINMAELTENYSQLQDQHKDTLNYIEELKEELTKSQAMERQSASPTVTHRASQLSPSKTRESQVFASLREVAVDNLQGKPQAVHAFEANINAAVAEAKIRSDRVTALESELISMRKELDVKNTMISGLTRERSVRPAPAMDISMVSTMRGHLSMSQQQLQALHESSSEREAGLLGEIQLLKTALASNIFNGDISNTTLDNAENEEVKAPSEARQKQIVALQTQISGWEATHLTALDLRMTHERQLLDTIKGLDTSLSNAENLHGEQQKATALRGAMMESPNIDFEAEKTKHLNQVNALQREIDGYRTTADAHASKLEHLENSYSQIIKEVQEDAKSRELTESELRTHRDLVSNLEHQIDQQKSLATFHQSGIKSLQESHSRELDEFKMTVDAQQAESDKKLTQAMSRHQASTSALQEELTKAHMELAELMQNVSVALDEDLEGPALQTRLRSLADERKNLVTQHNVTNEALKSAQKEMQSAKTITIDLKAKVQELTLLNEETLRQLEKSGEKENRSSHLVQELEDQLHHSFHENQTVNNRLSTQQSKHVGSEKELEEHRSKISQLEVCFFTITHKYVLIQKQNQITDMKRMTVSSNNARDSLASENGSQRRPSDAASLRKSNSHATLPSPPPAVPLPRIPMNLDITAANGDVSRSAKSPRLDHPSPPVTPRWSQRDPATQQQLDDQESRIKTIEKHLYAEKQLTQTLEEALMDLETAQNKTKNETEAWKKKCREVEEEVSGLRRERGTMRNSIQDFAEERDKRIRAEQARRQLEERMEALGKKTKKKGATLNCF